MAWKLLKKDFHQYVLTRGELPYAEVSGFMHDKSTSEFQNFVISFSKALGAGNLGEAEHLIWCYRGNLSPLACEQLRVKATIVDQLIMHDHDVLVHL